MIDDNPNAVGCPGPNDSIRPELERGGMIASTAKSPPSARVEALFRCSPERIFGLLGQYENLPQLIAGLDSAEVLDRSSDDATVAFGMKLPFPIGPVGWVNRVSRRQYGTSYDIRWSLVSGDLLESAGRLVMAPYQGNPNRTYANYHIELQTRTRLPQTAQRLATRWLLPRILKQLRTIAEQS